MNALIRQIVNPLLNPLESNRQGELSLEYKRIYTRDGKQTLLYEGQTLPGSEIKSGEGKLYNIETGNLLVTT